MTLGIMQPYFFPYLGYFQLINATDEFVVYDNIEFAKKGWINRNRVLVNGKDAYITIPLKKDSDFLEVKDRYLAESWEGDRKKILNRITESYRKAPEFKNVYPLIEKCILFEDFNLFIFILNSLKEINDYLEIQTPLVVSSTIEIDHTLKGEKKVLEICKARKATQYLNPIGGMDFYSKSNFSNEGIELHFLKANEFSYRQFNNEFVPSLSIIDVMMFNSKEEIRKHMNSSYSVL